LSVNRVPSSPPGTRTAWPGRWRQRTGAGLRLLAWFQRPPVLDPQPMAEHRDRWRRQAKAEDPEAVARMLEAASQQQFVHSSPPAAVRRWTGANWPITTAPKQQFVKTRTFSATTAVAHNGASAASGPDRHCLPVPPVRTLRPSPDAAVPKSPPLPPASLMSGWPTVTTCDRGFLCAGVAAHFCRSRRKIKPRFTPLGNRCKRLLKPSALPRQTAKLAALQDFRRPKTCSEASSPAGLRERARTLVNRAPVRRRFLGHGLHGDFSSSAVALLAAMTHGPCAEG